MAKISAKDATVLINGYKLSTYATAYETEISTNPVDATGFSDGVKNYIPSIVSSKISADMLWNSAAGTVHTALSVPGTTGLVTIIPEVSAVGGASISLEYLQSNYKPGADVSDILKVGSIEFETSNANNYGLEFGQVLYNGTITNTTTGTSYDNAAATSTRYSAVLHVFQAVASDTYAIKVQHSTDNSTWADLVTFTANGSTITAERKVGTAVNRYRRIVATRSGSAGNTLGLAVVLYTV